MSLERKQLPLRARVAAIVALGGAAALAACGGKAEKADNPAETPTTGPSPTRTAEPTPTPTAAPTIEPTQVPTSEPTVEIEIPTAEQVKEYYRNAYAQLDSTTLASLPENQTLANFERLFNQCVQGGQDPTIDAVAAINGCAGAARNVLEIPGSNEIGEFVQANAALGLYTIDLANNMFYEQEGRFDPRGTEQDFTDYLDTVVDRSFPHLPK